MTTEQVLSTCGNLIDAAELPAAATIDSLDPFTGQPWARVPDGVVEDVDRLSIQLGVPIQPRLAGRSSRGRDVWYQAGRCGAVDPGQHHLVQIVQQVAAQPATRERPRCRCWRAWKAGALAGSLPSSTRVPSPLSTCHAPKYRAVKASTPVSLRAVTLWDRLGA